MDNDNHKIKLNNNGINAVGLLGVAFIVLKLCGVINWSWWWVTAPFWGGAALVLIFLAVAIIIAKVIERKYG